MSPFEALDAHLHYGHWGAVITWFMIFASFIAFLPYQKKSLRRPTSTYLAFIVASAFD
jgi:hypothetical protein